MRAVVEFPHPASLLLQHCSSHCSLFLSNATQEHWIGTIYWEIKKKLASPDHPLLPPTTWEGAILGTFIQIRARVQQQSTQREEQNPQTATSVGTHSQSAYKSSVYCSGWVDLSINWSTGKESGYTLITVWWLKSIYAPTAFMWCPFSSFCPKSAEIHSHKANNSD